MLTIFFYFGLGLPKYYSRSKYLIVDVKKQYTSKRFNFVDIIHVTIATGQG